MPKHYTPTTEQVRDFWVSHGTRMPAAKGYREDECASEFDRWLAAHDDHVRAEALRDAAKLRRGADALGVESIPADWLLAEADRIADTNHTDGGAS